MVSPCCCTSLQRGTSILAIIDAIFGAITLVILGLALAAVFTVDPDQHKEIDRNQKTQAIVVCILLIISCVFQIALALYLRKGAKAKDERVCKVWLIVAVVLFTISIVSIGFQYHATYNVPGLASGVVGLLYKLYEIWVVASFRNEILRNANNIQFAA